MNTERKASNPWSILILVLLASIAPPLALFKVAPVMEMILAEFGVTAAQGGLISTLFSLVPIILSIPVGVIVSKYGNYRLGAASLIFVAVGSCLGAFSASLPSLYASRVIEGCGMALICTVGPAIVAEVFPDNKRGIAMGIFMWYVTLGQAFISTLAPTLINASGGWRGIWHFTTIYSAVFFFLWIFGLRGLKNRETASPGSAAPQTKGTPISQILKNRDILLLTICIMAFGIAIQGILAFYPTFFTQVKGLESAKAIRLTGFHGYIGCLGAVVSGLIMDKTGLKKWFGAIAAATCAILFALVPSFPASLAIVIILLVGFTVNLVPPIVYAAVPNACESPRDIAIAMGIVNTGLNLGNFLSAILFGAMLDSFGWRPAFFFSAAMGCICCLCMILLRGVKK